MTNDSLPFLSLRGGGHKEYKLFVPFDFVMPKNMKLFQIALSLIL